MNKIPVILFRVLMSFLVWFELLNWLGILHFSLVYTWQGLLIVAIFAWIAAEIIITHEKNLNKTLLLSLISISVLLDAFWDIFRFYDTIKNYDKFLHFFNSWVITYLVFIVLKDILKNANLGKYLNLAILITFGSFFWTLYEIEEFLEDILINHKQIRLWDGYDTAWDLLSNVSGCIIMALIIFFLIKSKKINKKVKI